MTKNKYGRKLVNEAVIKSYPINSDDGSASAKRLLIKNFHTITEIAKMETNPYWISNSSNYEKGDSTYKIYIDGDDLSEIMEISRFCDRSLGWLTIGIGVEEYDVDSEELDDTVTYFFTLRKDGHFKCLDMDNIDFYQYCKLSRSRIKNIFLAIEAKYTIETTDFKNLFHVTHAQYLPRIKQYGLVPKTNGTNTERVYFSREIEDSLRMLGHAFDSVNPPIVLGLWMMQYGDEIKRRYKFYEDPREDGAVYTYDVIDPKYIIIKLGDEWSLLSDIDTDLIKRQLSDYYKNRK